MLHGSFSYLIQDEEGQIVEPHSISAGLDYPGIGPEHSFLKAWGGGGGFSHQSSPFQLYSSTLECVRGMP